MRYPVVAGQFYPESERRLRMEIERCFVSPLGPGKIPEVNEKGERRIVGAVSPHAGYTFSGPVAAHVYSAIAQDGFPETFVIIGPNHQGLGQMVAMSTQDFLTPLGTVKADKRLAAKLGRWIDDDPLAHQYEHSIEVQLPFLQFLSPEFKLLPITMTLQDYETASELGAWLRRSVEGEDVVIIASSDLSHYVPEEEAERKDMKLIDRVLSLDSRGVYDTAMNEGVSACGYGPIVAMMEAVEAGSAKLLKYATSGDVHPMREVVGYGAITLMR